jgi:hypothetical protein
MIDPTSFDLVRIRSQWLDLSNPPRQESDLDLTRQGDRFVSAEGDNAIPIAGIESVVEALSEPPISRPCVRNMDFSPQWLERNAKQLIDDRYPDHSEAGRRRYLKKFREFEYFEQQVLASFSSQWTDDYPSFEIELFAGDERVLRASSSSQQPLMIPWTIDRPDGSIVTYNARVARSIGALLPDGFLNASRILALI